MVSRKACISLWRSLLSLLLTGLLLAGVTAGYCLTGPGPDGQVSNSKKADRVGKPSGQAAAEAAFVHAHSLKMPVLSVPGRAGLPVRKSSVRDYVSLKPA